MRNIVFSIIVPAHNSSGFVGRLLKSVPEREDIEVIIIDDHSNDFTELKKAAEKDSGLKSIRVLQNTGKQSAGAARNVGMQYATGEWVTFADSDDVFLPCFGDFLNLCAKNKTADIVLCVPKAEKIDGGESARADYISFRFGQFSDGVISGEELSYLLTNIWSKLYRRAAIKDILFSETLVANDVQFAIEAAFATRKKIVVDSDTLFYCVTEREGSITKSKHHRIAKYLTRVRTRLAADLWIKRAVKDHDHKKINLRRHESLLRKFIVRSEFAEATGKTRIAIFQNDLGEGGIQRSLINLLGVLDSEKYSVDLYLFRKDNFFEAELPKFVNVIYKKPQRRVMRFVPFSVYSILQRVDVKKEYDVAVDFNGYQNLMAIYALKTRAKKHIYWVHSDFLVRGKIEPSITKKLYSAVLLTKSKWRRFDTIVGVSDGVLEMFRKDFPNKELAVVQNAVDVDNIIELAKDKIDIKIREDSFNLIMVGRLEHVKGVDLFLADFKRILELRPKTHLYIIGDGAERENLERITKELSLDDDVTFLGSQKNPYKYMARMDGLVLNSHYEGQGMVLLEAKVLGLQLFFPKRLEKCNKGLKGSDDLIEDIVVAEKEIHKVDRLEKYNSDIERDLSKLFLKRKDGSK
jgi:glycosyltransferase involved in cell wall biosynthesis